MNVQVLCVSHDTEDMGFLDLPTEVRLKIYASLFKNSKLLLHENSQCSGLAGCYRRKRNSFDKVEVHAEIMLTCKKIFHEAQKTFYDKLVLSQSHRQHSAISNFVSPLTMLHAKTLENVQVDYTLLRSFQNLSMLLYKHVLYATVRDEYGAFDEIGSRELFTGIVRADEALYDYYTARKYCGYQVAKWIEVRKIDLIAEVQIRRCSSAAGRASGYGYTSKELTIVTHLPDCMADHEAVGIVYLDLNRAKAFYDRDEKFGRVPSLEAIVSANKLTATIESSLLLSTMKGVQ